MTWGHNDLLRQLVLHGNDKSFMRLKVIQLFFIFLFVCLVSFLFQLQIVRGDYYKELSGRNSIRLLNITAPRGIIYDRNNKIAADNVLSFGVFIIPQETMDLDEEISGLSDILNVPESLLRRNYKRNYLAPFAPCEVMANISKQKAILVEQLRLDMPGVLVKEIPLRSYPYRDAMAHVIGYLGEIDKRELESLKSYGYTAKDMIGKAGIEKMLDSSIRGRSGGMQVQVDNRGRQVKVLGSRSAKSGKDVYLTIDAELQNLIWKMMKGKNGAAVFMDAGTGEILSLVSMPSYDPNDSLGKVLNAPDAPLMNRAVSGQYPPGSLFKLVLSSAGLETGKIRENSTFNCGGKLDVGKIEFHCWNRDGHGPVNVVNALTVSCNVYFYNLGMLLGVDRIHEYAKMFGFGRKTGIELFGEAEGILPSKAWKRMEKKEGWYTGDTINFSIGQGYLSASPLQVVRMIAAIANGGELVQPHILKSVGNIDLDNTRKKIKLKVKSGNLDIVRKGMKGVVNDKNGTGWRAWTEVVSISGKTGTSQAGGGLRTHAWFGGFAPSENPEICFAVFLEHGGSGGDMPALIAKKAVEYWYGNR
jgi:penicillin-binding protein 2